MLQVFFTMFRVQKQGVMPHRPVPDKIKEGWLALAGIFEHLLGGNQSTRQAATYLRGLATDSLPLNPIHPLPWMSEEPEAEIIIASPEPHPVVLGVLCPSAQLRVVWRRNFRRWGHISSCCYCSSSQASRSKWSGFLVRHAPVSSRSEHAQSWSLQQVGRFTICTQVCHQVGVASCLPLSSLSEASSLWRLVHNKQLCSMWTCGIFTHQMIIWT